MATAGGSYESNVFVNCPFDSDYHPLLRPLLFTILLLGFTPKIASERSDSGEFRLAKISEFIRGSRYSIHDLSRIQARARGEFYRMNMPFELGLEYGCRLFGGQPFDEKRCLILEKRPYHYMKALSDLSGIDIENHNNEPISLVRQVRNWFVETVGVRGAPSATAIWYAFDNDFMADFYERRQAEGFAQDDLNMMPVPEYVDFIRDWLRMIRPGA
ncbi:MAG TPA: hypothetical protein VHG08_26395 [Longimicrobium sp.]|nr:hypothetical protein [Longimicrobium sp.]